MKEGSDTIVSFVRLYQRKGDRWEEYRWEFELPIGLSAYLLLGLVESVPEVGPGPGPGPGPKEYRLALKPLEEAHRVGIQQAPVAAQFNCWLSDGARG